MTSKSNFKQPSLSSDIARSCSIVKPRKVILRLKCRLKCNTRGRKLWPGTRHITILPLVHLIYLKISYVTAKDSRLEGINPGNVSVSSEYC
jgi:hypothetical protein